MATLLVGTNSARWVQFRVLFLQPVCDGAVQLIQSPGKKMVRAVHEHHAIVAGRYRQHLFHMLPGAVLIISPLDD